MPDLTELARAWYDEGKAPRYHQYQKDLLRHNWPRLYNAIIELVGEKK